MGIMKRMKDIATAEIHTLLDRAEDPIHMLNHYIREMEKEIANGQKALTQQLFLERRQQAFLDEAEETITKRSRQTNSIPPSLLLCKKISNGN